MPNKLIFAPQDHSTIAPLCSALESLAPEGADPDSLIDVRAVFQTSHRQMDLGALPPLLLPRKGKFGLTDYEKAFCAMATPGDIFDLRGIDREAGAVIATRPDQYVAQVLPLTASTELTAFLQRMLRL